MVLVHEVTCKKINEVEICTRGNYAQKCLTII
jgi:hypothetical protein